jgi:hypothetical protein
MLLPFKAGIAAIENRRRVATTESIAISAVGQATNNVGQAHTLQIVSIVATRRIPFRVSFPALKGRAKFTTSLRDASLLSP